MGVRDLFVPDPNLVGHVGVEQEFLLTDGDGRPSPRSARFLACVGPEDAAGQWTYELSACQVEYRTRPQPTLWSLQDDLRCGHEQGAQIAGAIGCSILCTEVAAATMPLDVYEGDPRFADSARRMSRKTLLARCRVLGIHVHYGCADLAHAIAVHDALVPYLDCLCAAGDHSKGRRLALYRQTAPAWRPQVYVSVEGFEQAAQENGFDNSLGNSWHLIRISRHGTVELRMFGNTQRIAEILGWVALIKEIADRV